jgi:hypothetical protein
MKGARNIALLVQARSSHIYNMNNRHNSSNDAYPCQGHIPSNEIRAHGERTHFITKLGASDPAYSDKELFIVGSSDSASKSTQFLSLFEFVKESKEGILKE